VESNNKRNRNIYWTVTGLISALMLMSAGMYIFNNTMVTDTFIKLGYPSYIIYPLAVLKILGIVAILTKKSKMLKEWAYAGFFFDFVLAFFAHIAVNDGGYMPSFVAIILLLTSYIYDKKIFN